MGKRKKPNYHNHSSTTMKRLKATCLRVATFNNFRIRIALVIMPLFFLEQLQDVEANVWLFLLHKDAFRSGSMLSLKNKPKCS